MEPIPESSLILTRWTADETARLEALMTGADFREANTRRDQIGRFVGGLKGATIKRQDDFSHELPCISGRPSVRSDPFQQWMVNLIHSRFEARTSITYVELMDLLQTHHEVSICSDTLRHTIRNLDTVKSVIGIPMEAERVAVDPAEIQAWFEELAAEVADLPRDFMFNVDETGGSDRTDSREVCVIASSPARNPSVPIPYDRHSKRSTLVACIAADGF
jgi:hypothetical protein